MSRKKRDTHNILYTSNKCIYCKKIKQFLTQQKVPYLELNIENNKRAAKDLMRLGMRSVPVLVIQGRTFQGFDLPRLKKFLNLA